MAYHNNPQGQIAIHTHQPLTIEHFGIHASIKENGKVIIRAGVKEVKGSDGEIEYDEVEVPATLIFKLATLLKDTRTTRYVNIVEEKK
jgi:hypothetical protein